MVCRGDNPRHARSAPPTTPSCAPACASRPSYTPVWLMRQAGRYLPEYNATRARAGSFMGLATNADYATEVTLQPLERYPARRRDPVLRHPDRARRDGPRPRASPQGEGPRFARPVRDEADVARARGARHGAAALRVRRGRVDPPRARRPGAADRLRRQPLDARLLHGRGRGLATTTASSRRCSTRGPTCCTASSPSTPRPWRLPERADRRRRAGGDGLRQLGRRARRRRLPGLQPGLHAARAAAAQARARRPARAAHRLHQGRRRRGSRTSRRSAPTCVGVDWTVEPRPGARARVGAGVALQGNLDPDRAVRRRRARSAPRSGACSTLRSARRRGGRPGHVFNLGHGISQHTPPESVGALVDAVHALSRPATAPTRDRNHEAAGRDF